MRRTALIHQGMNAEGSGRRFPRFQAENIYLEFQEKIPHNINASISYLPKCQGDGTLSILPSPL